MADPYFCSWDEPMLRALAAMIRDGETMHRMCDRIGVSRAALVGGMVALFRRYDVAASSSL